MSAHGISRLLLCVWVHVVPSERIALAVALRVARYFDDCEVVRHHRHDALGLVARHVDAVQLLRRGLRLLAVRLAVVMEDAVEHLAERVDCGLGSGLVSDAPTVNLAPLVDAELAHNVRVLALAHGDVVRLVQVQVSARGDEAHGLPFEQSRFGEHAAHVPGVRRAVELALVRGVLDCLAPRLDNARRAIPRASVVAVLLAIDGQRLHGLAVLAMSGFPAVAVVVVVDHIRMDACGDFSA